MTNVSDHSKRAVIDLNKFAHDNVAQNYDELHAEIFNPTEQARINNVIKRTLSYVATGTRTKNVLDFGSGTGNLTIHLWKLGAEVMA